jgi:hypothetical protein
MPLSRPAPGFELADPRLLDAAGAAPLLPAALRPALRVVPGIGSCACPGPR